MRGKQEKKGAELVGPLVAETSTEARGSQDDHAHGDDRCENDDGIGGGRNRLSLVIHKGKHVQVDRSPASADAGCYLDQDHPNDCSSPL